MKTRSVSLVLRSACLWIVFILWFGSGSTAQAQSSPDSSPDPVLLISIDGFAAHYLDRFPVPNLRKLAADGVAARSLIPVFPTKTFPTHYSMVTGLYPDQTGVISNNMEDSELPGRFSLRNREAIIDGRWYGGEPIWNTIQRQGLTAATLFWVGSEAEIGGMRPDIWRPYQSNMSYRARIDTVMEWLTRPGENRPDLVTLYLNRVDIAGHRYGLDSDELREAVAEADHWIGVLLEELESAGLRDRLNLILVSDHGMSALDEDRLVFLDDLIDLDRVDIIDWTPVAMMNPVDGESADEIVEQLDRHAGPFQIWRKEEIPERFNFGRHPRVPEIVMLADPGYMFTSHPFFERNGLIEATHGYDADHPEMHGILMASGPAFRGGAETESIHSIHLYRLICHLLAVEPSPNEGRLEAVQPLLQMD
ncbi:MAG: ectonucleotide pyrophosphatase/phosphodiesterase [Bacteroidota bacterium]